MTVINKIIHRFVHPRSDYEENGSLYDQIIPYNVQAYSYELKEGGDETNPNDYLIRYVLGTGRSTYIQIANGNGQDQEGNPVPELSKEFLINSSIQLNNIISQAIRDQVLTANYITYNVAGDSFPTKADLDNATTWYSNGNEIIPKQNDYVIVASDEEHTLGSGKNPTTRYVCTDVINNVPVWSFEYIVNNGNFTPEQEAAINSGITTEKVEQYESYRDQIATLLDHLTDYNNPHRVTAEQIGLGNVDNTSDLDKPISTATQEALDTIGQDFTEHTENTDIHVTLEEKETWTNKQDVLKMGNHIRISNDVISVEDDLAGYDNSISQFINKSVNNLENYYTKDELAGIYKYKGTVPTVDDLPTGNIYAPDTYLELQYITTDNLQYIDTHYKPNQKTRIEVKFKINEGIDTNYIYSTNLSEINKVGLGFNYSNNKANALFGNKELYGRLDNEIHTFIQKKAGIYLDNVQIGTYSEIADFTTDSTLWLFKAQNITVQPQNISIYEFDIYEDNVLVKQYIPALDRETNKAGVYEVVEGEFYLSEDSNSFVAGEIAGYGNQDGDVYKVLEDGTLYMWYNHQWVVNEQSISVDNVTITRDNTGELSAIGTINRNTAASADSVIYDWEGTLQQYETQQVALLHPDWLCYITDDGEDEAGVATYTELPPLPAGKDIKDFVLKWNHSTQKLEWIEVSAISGGIQCEIMPNASSTYANKIYQYIGNTQGNFINGHFYKCTPSKTVVFTPSGKISCDYEEFNKLVEDNLQPGTTGPVVSGICVCVIDNNIRWWSIQCRDLNGRLIAVISTTQSTLERAGFVFDPSIQSEDMFSYEVVEDGISFTWKEIEVQPSPNKSALLAGIPEAVSDSTASDLARLVTDFNDLLSMLRYRGVISNS